MPITVRITPPPDHTQHKQNKKIRKRKLIILENSGFLEPPSDTEYGSSFVSLMNKYKKEIYEYIKERLLFG